MMPKLQNLSVIYKIFVILVCTALLFTLCVSCARYLDYCPVDFAVFRTATRVALRGGNPYDVSIRNGYTGLFYSFYNPPWIIPFLVPFTILPERYGLALLWCCTFITYAYLVFNTKPTKQTILLIFTSAPMILDLYYGQINFLVWLGLLLPPPIGLLFLALKPQIGFGVILYRIMCAWKSNGWYGLMRLIWPLALISIISFVIYGFWPMGWQHMTVGEEQSGLWPYFLPLGVGLVVYAIKQKSCEHAILAMPFVAPHIWTHSLVGWLLQLQKYPKLLRLACIGLWVYEFLNSVLKII